MNAVFTAGRENGRSRPRGYADWRPQQVTRVVLEQVEQVLDEYADHLPLTIRQVFYRLVGAHGYEKSENGYSRLCELMNRARRARLIEFGSIRDDRVTMMRPDFYDGIEDFHDETARRARRYRRDLQAGQPQYLEVWCEAAGMIQQLGRVASPYSVPVYTAGGFASLTANFNVAQRALSRSVPTVLLHVGDYDPSGESIFTAMSQDAAAFCAAERVIETQRVEAVRVALTAAQVDEHELPTAPPKKTDGRSAGWTETCQLEALAPDVLAGIVDDAIRSRLDGDRLRAAQIHEAADRAELLALGPGRRA